MFYSSVRDFYHPSCTCLPWVSFGNPIKKHCWNLLLLNPLGKFYKGDPHFPWLDGEGIPILFSYGVGFMNTKCPVPFSFYKFIQTCFRSVFDLQCFHMIHSSDFSYVECVAGDLGEIRRYPRVHGHPLVVRLQFHVLIQLLHAWSVRPVSRFFKHIFVQIRPRVSRSFQIWSIRF